MFYDINRDLEASWVIIAITPIAGEVMVPYSFRDRVTFAELIYESWPDGYRVEFTIGQGTF